MTTQSTTENRAGFWNRAISSPPAIAGIGYAVAWGASQAVLAPSPGVAASGGQVLAAFGGHDWSQLAMFVLAEGIAAIALAVVVVFAARAARHHGAALAGLTAAGFGLAAVLVSWVELALGAWLTFSVAPSRRAASAAALYHAISRIDGAKMFLLAAMGVALAALAAKSSVLPRWLAPLGLLMAVTLVISGFGWILLASGLAGTSVIVSGVLLIAVVAAAGVTMRVGASTAGGQAGRQGGRAASASG